MRVALAGKLLTAHAVPLDTFVCAVKNIRDCPSLYVCDWNIIAHTYAGILPEHQAERTAVRQIVLPLSTRSCSPRHVILIL